LNFEYYKKNFDAVEGWANRKLFDVIETLNDCGINRTGGVLEIGVHHGKFFIMLNHVTSPEDVSFAIDVFGMQHLNIDGSGLGNRYMFEQNLKQYDIHKGENTKIFEMDSLSFNGGIMGSSLRFISVDGGHTVEHTMHDLKLAERLIANEGVIILDDIMGEYWCGVTEGYIKYALTYPSIVPFAMGLNKLFLCKLSHQEHYFKIMQKLSTKQTKFVGYQIIIVE
jgi:hypothetical protein